MLQEYCSFRNNCRAVWLYEHSKCLFIIDLYVKLKCFVHMMDQNSSDLHSSDTPEPMFYSDEHCGQPSTAGQGCLALSAERRHLLSHAWKVHLQSARQAGRQNPQVMHHVTHRRCGRACGIQKFMTGMGKDFNSHLSLNPSQ